MCLGLSVKFTKLSSNVYTPSYASPGAAGLDLRAFLPKPVSILPFERLLVPTGLSFEIPPGYELQVRPRSGLSSKHGITVLNTPGTIDSDYRGEVKVLLVNLSSNIYTVQPDDRIAQLVLSPVIKAKLIETDSLNETSRGTGGFGSTGK